MAVPVIDSDSSILEYDQFQSWQFQPYATNTPTAWEWSNLPAGITYDDETGRLTAAAEVAGTFNVPARAENGDGWSAAVRFTIHINPAAATMGRSGFNIEISLDTHMVKLLNAGSGEQAGKLFARANDDLVLWIQFRRGELIVDPQIAGLAIAIKEYDPEARLVLGDVWKKFGSGAGAYYGLYAKIDRDQIAAALSNYESDSQTLFDGVAEIEWLETNPDSATFGPAELRFSTRDFNVLLASDKVDGE